MSIVNEQVWSPVDVKIVGMVLVNHVVSVADLDYQTALEPGADYCIYGVNDAGRKFEFHLWEDIGPCGSGYCMASWGYCSISVVASFPPFSHRVKPGNNVTVRIYQNVDGYALSDRDEKDEVVTEAFSWSSIGFDPYYPSGYAYANMDIFEELPRSMGEKRPVWIFYGKSGAGKSSLAYMLNDHYIVYETDSSDELPQKIMADVIVVGNKHKYKVVDDIISRIEDPINCKIIPVCFDVYKE